jgi:membrane protease YdiL (CAAX protease family)
MPGAREAADGAARAPRTGAWSLAGWTALDLGIAAALAFGSSLLVASVLGFGRSAGWVSAPPVAALSGLPAFFVPLSVAGSALAGLLLYRLHRHRLAVQPGPWTPGLGLAVLVGALVLQAAAVGLALLAEAAGVANGGSNLPLIRQAFAEAPALTLLAILVLAPLGEELVFRRVLLERFARAGRALPGLLFTALAFALIHEPLPGGRSLLAWGLTLLPYAVLAVGFGLFYLRCRRVDATILLHALVNALGFALLHAGA